MSIIVQNGVFQNAIDGNEIFIDFAEWRDNPYADAFVDVASDTDPLTILPFLPLIAKVRIAFPSSADGRGQSIAKTLRRHGFKGHLRAAGHIHADQYPLTLRCGFNDVEIDQNMATRQPEALWRETLPRLDGAYLDRLTSPIFIRNTDAMKAN